MRLHRKSVAHQGVSLPQVHGLEQCGEPLPHCLIHPVLRGVEALERIVHVRDHRVAVPQHDPVPHEDDQPPAPLDARVADRLDPDRVLEVLSESYDDLPQRGLEVLAYGELQHHGLLLLSRQGHRGTRLGALQGWRRRAWSAFVPTPVVRDIQRRHLATRGSPQRTGGAAPRNRGSIHRGGSAGSVLGVRAVDPAHEFLRVYLAGLVRVDAAEELVRLRPGHVGLWAEGLHEVVKLPSVDLAVPVRVDAVQVCVDLLGRHAAKAVPDVTAVHVVRLEAPADELLRLDGAAPVYIDGIEYSFGLFS
mmetsp:Transcript_48532/g.137189  ORF Transcript_48532/g.137189 Transcript_48532/m.137189 type:complete len:305 (+) Transcript_48532:166-1080(+)